MREKDERLLSLFSALNLIEKDIERIEFLTTMVRSNLLFVRNQIRLLQKQEEWARNE